MIQKNTNPIAKPSKPFFKGKKFNPIRILIWIHFVILGLSLILLFLHKGKPDFDKEKIVVVPIEGLISMKSGSLGRGQSVDAIVSTLTKIRDEDNVKAVILRINSPGGTVGAVQEIFRCVKKLKDKGKVVISSFGDVAASGGYYIACAGNRIICNPGSITGSIGVVMQIPNIQGLMQKVGIKIETVKSGSMKDAGSPFRQMTSRERQYFRTVILDAYEQFYEAVRLGRKIADKDLKELADGRIFSGRMALKNKLVDGLGGLEEAITLAKKMTGLENKRPTIVFRKDRPSLERLLNLFTRSPLQDLNEMTQNGIKLLYVMQ